MSDICFIQFSNKLINPNSLQADSIDSIYYQSIYNNRNNAGYYKGEHFWEIPIWISEVNGSIQALNKDYYTHLYIVRNIQDAIEFIKYSDFDYYLFSILDANKVLFDQILVNSNKSNQFVLGGYIDFTFYKEYSNLIICSSVQDFIKNVLNEEYIYNIDNTLFSGLKIIPRLTLSTGCKHICKFCTIEKNIVEFTKRDILKQINSFKCLQFKLIYLNDKTFFQAKNYSLLKSVYKKVKKFNPSFEGFIVQTTCLQAVKHSQEFKELNIKFVELGIETVNNNLLKGLNKPQNEEIINQALNSLKDVKIIPNILIGILNENNKTYKNTLKTLKRYKSKLSHLNIYNLAIYNNTKLAEEIKTNNSSDLNELDLNKSFHSKDQIKANNKFFNQIFNFGLNVLEVQI